MTVVPQRLYVAGVHLVQRFSATFYLHAPKTDPCVEDSGERRLAPSTKRPESVYVATEVVRLEVPPRAILESPTVRDTPPDKRGGVGRHGEEVWHFEEACEVDHLDATTVGRLEGGVPVFQRRKVGDKVGLEGGYCLSLKIVNLVFVAEADEGRELMEGQVLAREV